MSANIFKVKINRCDVKHIGVEELLEYCFESPKRQFNFKKYVDLLSIELESDESARHLAYSRFHELLKTNRARVGDGFFAPLVELYGHEFENLHESYRTSNITELVHPKVLIWNNILADLGVPNFQPLPVAELDIEMAQDQDGIAAFPDHRGLGIKSVVYREFFMRVLAGIQNQTSESAGKIADWIESRDGTLYPDYPNRIGYGNQDLDFDGEEGIVWGIEQRSEIVIELDDATFQDDYKGAWWLERIKSNFNYWKSDSAEWADANKDYPFQVKAFSVILHPAWFDSLSRISLDTIYDSTAYGY